MTENDPFNEIPKWAQRDLRDIPITGNMGDNEWHEVGFGMGKIQCQVAVIDRKWVVLGQEEIDKLTHILYVFDEDGQQLEIRHYFCDSCPNCRPALVNMETAKALPDDDPKMRRILLVWHNHTSYQERRAYMDVTSGHSDSEQDMKLSASVMEKFKAAQPRKDEQN